MKLSGDDRNSSGNPRKVYAVPKLSRYGDITSLTMSNQTGSKNADSSASGCGGAKTCKTA